MVYHMLINSDDEWIAKKIVEEQEETGYEQCWFGNLQEEGKEIGLEVNKTKVLDVKKSAWKKIVKTRILDAFECEFRSKKSCMRKLRFLQYKAIDTYLHMQHLRNDDARMAVKIRLNMIDTITHNFGTKKNCLVCEEENDTTEHVFECVGLGTHDLTVENLKQGTRMQEVVELFRKMEDERKDILINNIVTNFNVFQREELMQERVPDDK